MAKKPENCSGPPEPIVRSEYGKYDALSDVLQMIHLRGGEVAYVACADLGQRHEHPCGARLVHIVEHGCVRVEIADEKPVELAAGDLVLLARGESHVVRGEPYSAWVTGEFLADILMANSPLSTLPSVIVVRGEAEETRWLPLSLSLMLAEVNQPRPGSRVMVSRLLDLLFIRALRFWADSGEQANPGWLTAAMDPVLGKVLTAIHRSPERDWSIDELARLSALSRSAFATRFSALLGEPPGAYVLRQRLEHAARLLLSTSEPVGRIAVSIGYTEAAFSRAFARAYGEAPRAWRVARTAVPWR
jgi:AraC-like DNA-binding protein